MTTGSHKLPKPTDTEQIFERLDSLATQVEDLSKQVQEIHTVRKLFGWTIPMLVTAAVSFVITAAVGLYKVDELKTTLTEHRSASALQAHPGTADVMFGIRQDLQHTRDALESAERERGIRDETTAQHLGRIDEALSALLAETRANR
jgi:hypothetical protein